jgi:hypothetical protein
MGREKNVNIQIDGYVRLYYARQNEPEELSISHSTQPLLPFHLCYFFPPFCPCLITPVFRDVWNVPLGYGEESSSDIRR